MFRDGIRAVISEKAERDTVKRFRIVEQCDVCNAPQMVMPDGEHRCGLSPSYTLADLEPLMHQYALEMENSEEGRQDINLRLTMSSLLAWLARREKEQGDERGL